MYQTIITQNNIDEIIAREIEGSAAQHEIDALQKWISESEENKIYYTQMHQVDDYYNGRSLGKIDTEAAWSKVNARINSNLAGTPRDEVQWMPSLKRYMGYAAALAIFTTIGFIFYNKIQSPQIFVSTNAKLTHELEDGSLVNLDKNSALSLIYKNKREYKFSGKAQFKVIHKDELPFVLHIDKILVKDLGTVFTVNAMPGNDTVQVKVSEGSVQFYTIDNIGMMLKIGEEAIYIKSKNKFLKRNTDAANQLLSISFQNSTLGDVIDQLSYSYRKNILFENEAIKNCNITVDFEGAEYKLVKEIIEETLNVIIEERNQNLYIKGLGCQ